MKYDKCRLVSVDFLGCFIVQHESALLFSNCFLRTKKKLKSTVIANDEYLHLNKQ
jgi:hypothetical protein